MTRLTNDLRKSIGNKAIEMQFEKRQKALAKIESDLGMKLYKSLFDSALLAKIKKIPANWFRMDSCLRFNCGGYDLRFNIKDKVAVPYSSDCSRLGNISGELAEEAQQWAKDKEAYSTDIRAAYNAVLALLNSVGTIAQLEKAWPDGKPFYQQYSISVAGTAVPALQVNELNNLLGLKAV